VQSNTVQPSPTQFDTLDMDHALVFTMQQRIIASISRSAVVILSNNLNKRLGPYFSAFELILVLLVFHMLLNAAREMSGFNPSWRTLRDLVQVMMVRSLASYVCTDDEYTTILNLVLVLVTLECIPASKGWIGDDVEYFTSIVSFVFSDKISESLTELGIPLCGAALALCLGGKGLLGHTLAFTGINTLSSVLFEAIEGGELSLAWPVTLLYFVHEASARYDLDSFFGFGLYRAGDAIYSSLTGKSNLNGLGLTPATIFMAFLFLGSLFPSDPVWAGVCVLVFVQGGSDWFLAQLSVISTTDPVLAGLSLVTAVHFISVVVEKNEKI
jgi:hypothetical protein